MREVLRPVAAASAAAVCDAVQVQNTNGGNTETKEACGSLQQVVSSATPGRRQSAEIINL